MVKDYQQAIVNYNRAIELNPNDIAAHYQRGRTYVELKDYQRAIADFDHTFTLELSTNDARAYSSRGFGFLWLRDTEQAKSNYARSWELDPTDINSGWMAEWSSMCQKKPDPAMAERLEQLASVDPQSDIALVCRGVALLLRGKPELSLTELEHSLTVDESEDGYFWKGMACITLGQDKEATVAIEQSLKEDLPPVLLAPLRWFEQDRPEFYEKYVAPLLANYDL